MRANAIPLTTNTAGPDISSEQKSSLNHTGLLLSAIDAVGTNEGCFAKRAVPIFVQDSTCCVGKVRCSQQKRPSKIFLRP